MTVFKTTKMTILSIATGALMLSGLLGGANSYALEKNMDQELLKFQTNPIRQTQEKMFTNKRYISEKEITFFTKPNNKEEAFKKEYGDIVYVNYTNPGMGFYSIKNEKGESAVVEKGRLVTDKSELIKHKYDGVDYKHKQREYNFKSNPRVEAKGIFLTANTFVSESKMDHLIKMTKETEINTFVIDVKNDAGALLFKNSASEKYVDDPYYYKKDYEYTKSMLKKLKDNNIYTIARIVTFKSPKYADSNKERAITYKSNGAVYKNNHGISWASAYDRNLWDYNLKVSKEAARLGFNEIQFDYVRFPALSKSKREQLDMKNKKNETRTEAIQKFLIKAKEELSKEKVYVGADIFGWATTTSYDSGIGQHWEGLSTVVDYTLPMVYPSHYGTNNFGLKVPDANPYKTIYGAIEDAIRRNKHIDTPGTLRPWLQDFTATWVKGYINYGANEVRAQIKALEDLGVNEYILWSPSNKYTWEALRKQQ